MWVCVCERVRVCLSVCYPERVWIFIISHSVFINTVITTSSVDYLCTRMGWLGLSGKMLSFFFFFFIPTGSQVSKQQQEAAFLVTVSLSWMVCVSVCLSTCDPSPSSAAAACVGHQILSVNDTKSSDLQKHTPHWSDVTCSSQRARSRWAAQPCTMFGSDALACVCFQTSPLIAREV